MSSPSPYRHIVENFRLSIRRQQIDQIFENQRRDIKRQMSNESTEQLRRTLIKHEKKIQWIIEKGEVFADFPSFGWETHLKQLCDAVPLYVNMHDQWVKCGLIKSLCDLFKEEYLYLNMSKIVANILSDIFYMNYEKQCTNLFKSILEIEFIDDLIPLMIRNGAVQYVRFMALIYERCPTIRNFCEEKGCLEFITSKMQELEDMEAPNSQYTHTLFYFVRASLKIHQFDANTFDIPKKSTIFTLIPFINRLINKTFSIQSTRLLLQSINQICKAKKIDIFQELSNQRNIIDKLMEMLCFEGRSEVRLICAEVISSLLLSDDNNIQSILLSKDILSRVYECSNFFDTTNKLKYYLLIIISNFMADKQQNQLMLLQHPLMRQFVIQQLHNPITDENRKQSLYCICSILQTIQGELLENVVKEFGLMQHLVDYLRDGRGRVGVNFEVVGDILETFIAMIKNCNQWNGNWVYQTLKQYFCIGDILSEIDDGEVTQNCLITFMQFFQNYEK